ncbi:MAG: hypothetical protein KatS3mg087_0037 [Patescibacteria group bacterium]|nr:MAG: hypothetical protein KatS3mg087_0037 [Patescibacteria group bacterium]
MTTDYLQTLDNIFPAPWDDRISKQVPITVTDALYWCEYVALSNQHLASALRKLASFFITDVEVIGAGNKVDEIKEFVHDALGVHQILHSIALDYLVYGNAFVTLYNPIERTVSCPKCSFGCFMYAYATRPEAKFAFRGNQFFFKCVKCGYEGPFDTRVYVNPDPEKLVVIRWNVHDMLIDDDIFSGRCRYTLRVPQQYAQKIKNGGPLQLSFVPEEFLEAVLKGEDFVFNDDAIIHLKEPTLAGLYMGGWGLSPILANFRQTWFIEVLRRANTAIAYDYIIPLRIIAPETRTSGPEFGDPALTLNMGSITADLEAVIRSWRKDPTGWYSIPFPVRYQIMGAEGQRIIPAPLIEQANRDLIAGLNLPVEFFYGNLQMQAAPMALRLLEGTWSSIPRVLNYFLSRLASFISRTYNWDAFKLRLSRPSHVDDVNRQMARLQLAMNNIISMTSGLESIGLSFREETRKRMEEQQFLAEESEKLQKYMESEQMNDLLAMPQQQPQGPIPPEAAPMGMAGPGPQGGGAAPPPPGGQNDPVSAILASVPELTSDKISPQDIISAADQIANQLMNMDPSLRRSALIRIKNKNSILHALVIRKIDELEQNIALQAKVQARQGGNQRQLV